ncbi:hypothetical protein FSP39_021228 [Pinctada imbricata]|uniref:Epimerase family protein SDR39U1 n=1 Tax=Pinctada imbricata TaxID=66713 RepID=A0AA88XJZ8_PINIB|nr:hypothetical protein FSP39_021228 [Pinctada imbricata]
MLQLLVEHSSMIDNSDGMLESCPLSVAMSQNWVPGVRYLLSKSVDLTQDDFVTKAVQQGQQEMLELLLEGGADVNETSPVFGFTPLHQACMSLVCPLNILELLIRHGADINKQCMSQNTALHYASQNMDLNKIKILFLNGANPHLKNKRGITPLEAGFGSGSNVHDFKAYLEIFAAFGTKMSKEMGDSIRSNDRDLYLSTEIPEIEELVKSFSSNVLPLLQLSRIAIRKMLDFTNGDHLTSLTGGTGFIGLNIQRKLLDNGWTPMVLTRRKKRFKDQGRVMDLADLNNQGLPDGLHGIINVAGLNLLNPFRRWNDQFIEDVTKSRVDLSYGLTSAITAMAEPPKVYISISGVAVYPTHDPSAKYTEEYTPPPFDWLSQFTKEWERANMLHEGYGVRTVCVRSGVVLGRDGGMIQQTYLPFFLGLGGPIGSGKQWFPWIHVEDLAGIFVHALTNENVSGILNGVAPEPVTNAGFAKAFGKALHRPAFIPLPSFVMQGVYGSTRSKMILQGQQVYPKRTLESGYQYLYPDIESACNQLAKKKK